MRAAARAVRSFFSALREGARFQSNAATPEVRIGLALGGGFARGIAHAGVLEVLERYHIPIHCVAGVSAGSIAAAAYASGLSPAEIAHAGTTMRLGDVARWTLGRLGFVASERMQGFLEKLLKRHRFEEMKIRLGVLATDLCTGESVGFRDSGDVCLPIRGSCSYPGLFQPVRCDGRLLVDGAMSMEIPALMARQLGATHVISVHLPAQNGLHQPSNVFQVVNRCFQIMHARTEQSWRAWSDLVISPDVRAVEWDGFGNAPELLKAGEAAALAAVPKIQSWLGKPRGADTQAAHSPCEHETLLGVSRSVGESA